tara:strand:+ start:733 stop:1464 length:732 start_codon:yes stop_codon:yes gene_type:complete
MNKYKDKLYELQGNNTPIINKIPSRHTSKNPLLYFDEEKGHNRELRYATNQKSPFVDEQRGIATLGHIAFRNGKLHVEGKLQNLIKFLEIHPLNGKLFKEFNKVEIAEDQLDYLEFQVDSMKYAKDMEIEQAEAILRVEVGSEVSKMTTKEIRRDLIVMAQRNPKLFLDLVKDDNIMLRNLGIKATEAKIIALSEDQRVFKWASNGRKLFEVPHEEHPYSALAAWFKTDEGMEVFKTIEKRLN